jgi:L-ascorbate metabolism protein UlaG (beta-lactamase superfamily)
MESINISFRKRFLLTLIITAMTLSVFPQDMPAFDRINTSSGVVELHFIGHGTLMFRFNEFVIHIDPVNDYGDYKNMPKADLILVTHEHSDHLDTGVIELLRKNGTVLLCSKSCISKVPWAEIMSNGSVKVISGIKVEAVPAYNIKHMRSPGQPFHPKGIGNGYVLTIGDKRIYIAGDTENTPEMKALKDINIAFLPMNLPYTMTPEMVADAVKSFRPDILYPYHFGNTKTENLISLLKETNIEVRIRNLK